VAQEEDDSYEKKDKFPSYFGFQVRPLLPTQFIGNPITEIKQPVESTRPLNVVLTKNVAAVQGGQCYLGIGQAIQFDGMDFIIVANTKENLDKRATQVRGDGFTLPAHKYHPVAVIHEAAVTLEDDEL
jgi:hypothetical protein